MGSETPRPACPLERRFCSALRRNRRGSPRSGEGRGDWAKVERQRTRSSYYLIGTLRRCCLSLDLANEVTLAPAPPAWCPRVSCPAAEPWDALRGPLAPPPGGTRL